MDKVFLVTTKENKKTSQFEEILQLLDIHYKCKYEIKYYTDTINEYSKNSIALLYINDEQIRLFIKQHLSSDINIGILPLNDNTKVQSSYGISSDLHEALDDALQYKNLSSTDILLCNGEPVFTNVIIGDVHELNNASIEKLSFIKKVKKILTNLNNLNFQEFSMVTAKEQKIKTAAAGIMIFEHNSKNGHYNIINEDFSLHDGQLNALVLAPTSILSYIYYLFIVFIYNHFSMKKLPRSIGVIKTSHLIINSKDPIEYKVDGVLLSTKNLHMEVLKDKLNISMGKDIVLPQNNLETKELKESVKVQYLPKGEMKNLLLSEKIPFFKKADENDFKELFLSLRDSAKLSSVFLILMILSSLLATTGLFQSSAPVIIGAMILAPLMSPIVSLAMGVVRGESELIKNSSKTLSYGIITALIFSCIYTYFMPLSHITNEIQARLNPNILDLMVAILSGIAGAYASAKNEVAKSLAGVAIAVALVPPLGVTGIGIAWWDINIIYGSFLLFLTNLVGITLAAAITFIILGYAPIHRAKKGLIYTSIILVVVTIPLILSFSKLIEQNKIASMIKNKYTINNKNISIDILDIDLNEKKPIIKLESLSEDILKKEDLKDLKQQLELNLKKSIVLKVHSKIIIK